MTRGGATLAVALLAACGGGGDAPRCAVDAGVPAELGSVETGDSNVSFSPMGHNLFLEIFIDPDASSPDLLELELYSGNGVFAGGRFRTGSFVFSGSELRYDSCGACLLLLVDRDGGTLKPAAYYMPRSGTLRLETVDGRITGVLEDVTLRHVAIDFSNLATTPIDDGCEVHLTRAAFDVPFADAQDAGP